MSQKDKSKKKKLKNLQTVPLSQRKFSEADSRMRKSRISLEMWERLLKILAKV